MENYCRFLNFYWNLSNEWFFMEERYKTSEEVVIIASDSWKTKWLRDKHLPFFFNMK